MGRFSVYLDRKNAELVRKHIEVRQQHEPDLSESQILAALVCKGLERDEAARSLTEIVKIMRDMHEASEDIQARVGNVELMSAAMFKMLYSNVNEIGKRHADDVLDSEGLMQFKGDGR